MAAADEFEYMELRTIFGQRCRCWRRKAAKGTIWSLGRALNKRFGAVMRLGPELAAQRLMKTAYACLTFSRSIFFI